MSDREVARQEREAKVKDKLGMQRPGLFAGGNGWIRHSEYEITADKDGNYRLAPAKGATVNDYRPFDYYPEILRDFLAMAKRIRKEGETFNPDFPSTKRTVARRRAEAYLEFANEYGPLGLVSYYSQDFRYRDANSDEVVVILESDNHIADTTMMPLAHYASVFFPAPVPQTVDELTVKSPNYSEPCELARYAMYDLLDTAEDWERFRAGKFSPEDEYRPGIKWNAWLSITGAWPVGVKVGYHQGHWQLEWMSKSLLEAINIMFVLNMTTGDAKQQVRFCQLKGCGVPFIARHPDQTWCSTRHASQVRTARKLKKQADAAAMYADGVPVEEIAQRLDSEAETIKGWVAKPRRRRK